MSSLAAVNGLSYGNLNSITATVGDKVSWHLMAIGKFSDEHTVSFEGQTVLHNSRRTAAVAVFPGVSETAIMEADIPGNAPWSLICHHYSYVQFEKD